MEKITHYYKIKYAVLAHGFLCVSWDEKTGRRKNFLTYRRK